MQKRKSKLSVKSLTVSAMIAAIYVVLSYLCEALGLFKGAIQIRLPEALCVLCAFTPYAVPGITLGCFLANFLMACAPIDIFAGSIATLIGAYFGRIIAVRTADKKASLLLATIPTFISNAIIMPPVISYAYGSEQGITFVFLTVGIGELISAVILGTMLGISLKKTRIRF